jgi:hypothetical protein
LSGIDLSLEAEFYLKLFSIGLIKGVLIFLSGDEGGKSFLFKAMWRVSTTINFYAQDSQKLSLLSKE